MSIAVSVVPVFALIAVGALAGRYRWLGDGAATGLNRFVVNLALPAMLYVALADARWSEIADPSLAFALVAMALALHLPVMLLASWRGASLSEASVAGLNASYGNTGFMGLPLVQLTLGSQALPGAGLAVVMTACVLFAVAITCIEYDRSRGQPATAVLRTAAPAILLNPLLVAPALGALTSFAGWRLPAALQVPLSMLAAAAGPCALVGVGLFLASARRQPDGSSRGAVTLSALKLLLQPVLAWWIAAPLLGLPSWQVQLVVLMALLPVGTGPFMIAERYGHGAALSARVMVFTTAASAVTIPLFLAWMGS